MQRQELILKKMQERGIKVGSGIPNKKYDSKEVYELIHIANCFPELRKKIFRFLLLSYLFWFLYRSNNQSTNQSEIYKY